MKLSIKQIGKSLGIFVFITIFVGCLACRTAQTQVSAPTEITASPTSEPLMVGEARKWIPGSYLGIEIGKSTRKDVIKKFGKPVWEGEEELEGEEEDIQKTIERNSGKRILLEFKNVGKMEGRTSILIGEKDKVVQAVGLYPTIPFTREAIILRYGDDFVEMYSNETFCSILEKSRPKITTGNATESLDSLVFPEIGMYASLAGTEEIDQMWFLPKCSD